MSIVFVYGFDERFTFIPHNGSYPASFEVFYTRKT